MFNNFKSIFTPPYMTTVPAGVPHTQNNAQLEKRNSVLFDMGKYFYSKVFSRTLMFSSFLLDQLTLVVTMQFWPLVQKYHAWLSNAGLIPIVLGEETCKGIL
jgi:hypothetical protein